MRLPEVYGRSEVGGCAERKRNGIAERTRRMGCMYFDVLGQYGKDLSRVETGLKRCGAG